MSLGVTPASKTKIRTMAGGARLTSPSKNLGTCHKCPKSQMSKFFLDICDRKILDICDFGHLWLWTFVTKFIWWVLLEVSRSIRLQYSHRSHNWSQMSKFSKVSHKCPNLQKSVTNVQNFGHLWQKILMTKVKSQTSYSLCSILKYLIFFINYSSKF